MPRTTSYEIDQMSRAQLEIELSNCRGLIRDGTRARDVERANARVASLEARDAERANELRRTQAELRVALRRFESEQAMRQAADRERDKFHALLIQERVRKIPERTT